MKAASPPPVPPDDDSLRPPTAPVTGIDLSLLRENLKLSPWERILANDGTIILRHGSRRTCRTSMQRLGELIERLARHDVEFVLVGGLAAAIHGSSLATRDVDGCCRFSEANLMRIQSALSGPPHSSRRATTSVDC